MELHCAYERTHANLFSNSYFHSHFLFLPVQQENARATSSSSTHFLFVSWLKERLMLIEYEDWRYECVRLKCVEDFFCYFGALNRCDAAARPDYTLQTSWPRCLTLTCAPSPTFVSSLNTSCPTPVPQQTPFCPPLWFSSCCCCWDLLRRWWLRFL